MLDHRMTCLDRIRREFDGLTTVLAAADAQGWAQAHQAVADLSPVMDCADLERVQNRVPPPERTERSEVAQIGQTLAQARALLQLGDARAALQLARTAERSSEPLEYGPVKTDVALILGAALSADTQHDEAETHLRDALSSAAPWQ